VRVAHIAGANHDHLIGNSRHTARLRPKADPDRLPGEQAGEAQLQPALNSGRKAWFGAKSFQLNHRAGLGCPSFLDQAAQPFEHAARVFTWNRAPLHKKGTAARNNILGGSAFNHANVQSGSRRIEEHIGSCLHFFRSESILDPDNQSRCNRDGRYSLPRKSRMRFPAFDGNAREAVALAGDARAQ
jgi:hypothetical protein